MDNGVCGSAMGPDEDLLKNEEAKGDAASSQETSGVNLEDDENVKEAPSGNQGVINIKSSEDLGEVHSEKKSMFVMFMPPGVSIVRILSPYSRRVTCNTRIQRSMHGIVANDRLCYEYQIDGYHFYYFGDSLDEVVSYAGPRTLAEFGTFISAQVTERVDDPIQNIDLKSLRLGQVKGIQELGIACNDCKAMLIMLHFCKNSRTLGWHKLMQTKRGTNNYTMSKQPKEGE